MTERDLFGFRVEIDEEATRNWYAQADEWDCDCGDCRNFLKQARARTLPAPVLALLDGLGIPPEKSIDVCEYGPEEGGRRYDFVYRIAGRILSGDEQRDSAKFDWGMGTCFHDTYPGAPDFPEPHFDLYFSLTMPWVLDEPRD